MIADSEIRSADPAAVVEQYEKYIQKLANRYISEISKTGAVGMDDLLQIGRIAVMDAQQTYDQERGSFMNHLFYCVRNAMRRELGFNTQTGAPPRTFIYLDAPISAESELTLGDTIADPDAVPLDEPITDDETKRETSEQVHAALDRMKSDKQRAAVSLVWLEGKSRQAAADALEMKPGAFYSLEKAGRSSLRRDFRLKKYAESMPYVHFSITRFNTLWTSETEYIAMWRMEHLPQPVPKKQSADADDIRAIWNREHAQ